MTGPDLAGAAIVAASGVVLAGYVYIGGPKLIVDPDPFLDPAGADDPSPLDTVDPAWGLGSAHPDYPPRAAARAARVALPDPCVFCDGTGFVVTHEDGGAGYRPCHRCPAWGGGAA